MLKDYNKVNCIICENEKKRPIGTKGYEGFPTYSCICTKCGLVYLNPRWSKEKYDHFYRYEYDKYYRPNEINKIENPSRYNNIKDIVKRLQEAGFVQFQNVLDIGCGMGYSLEYLREKNLSENLFAIESSENCLNHLQRKGIKVIANDVDQSWYNSLENSFDLIIMRHVLEHFLNPIDVLKKARSTLNKNGVIYIAVPDALNLTGSLFNYYFRVVHTFYFSKYTLNYIALKSNLKPLSIVAVEKQRRKNPELFGIFEKSICGEDVVITSDTYKLQLKRIRQHIFKEKLLLPLLYGKKYSKLLLIRFSRILPKSFQVFIKQKYQLLRKYF